MNTAQARNAASEAAAELNFAEALRLWELAISVYPMMPGKTVHGGAAILDIERMRAEVAGLKAWMEEEAAV